ncbi:MAG: hypothetical protein PHG51_06320 [Candidatus Omnitrophica bacterium]|nr:hypothetical protein [Candidatus Omnitrophota bacterium]
MKEKGDMPYKPKIIVIEGNSTCAAFHDKVMEELLNTAAAITGKNVFFLDVKNSAATISEPLSIRPPLPDLKIEKYQAKKRDREFWKPSYLRTHRRRR